MRTLSELPLQYAQMILEARVKDCSAEGDCWLWMGARDRKSRYGRLTKDSICGYTHRVFYELLVGQIPEGLQLDHLCRVPACCNPDHLEPVTGLVNVRRGMRATKTHCKRGHELDGDNVYVFVSKKGTHRTCKTCRDAYAKRYREEASERRKSTWAKYRAEGVSV